MNSFLKDGIRGQRWLEINEDLLRFFKVYEHSRYVVSWR